MVGSAEKTNFGPKIKEVLPPFFIFSIFINKRKDNEKYNINRRTVILTFAKI